MGISLSAAIRRLIPVALKAPLRRVWKKLRNRRGQFFCPICESRVLRFGPFGFPPRSNARCPVCGCLERHRLAWVWIERHSGLLSGDRIRLLHIAPDPSLAGKLRRWGSLVYLTGDLHDPRADRRLDLIRLDLEDSTFDAVYCSHVLEHVDSDRRALAEMYRVLAPGGFAAIQIPITAEKTDEDPSVTDPQERLRRFGQEDHVRRYGPDVADRFRDAGFQVEVFDSRRIASPEEATRMGFVEADAVYVCRKAVAARVSHPSSTIPD